MKKITLFFAFLISSIGFVNSQTEIATNGDFETGTTTGWLLFQNGGSAALDNTLANGGAWSGKLQTGGPSNPAFKQEMIGVGTVAAGSQVTISFDLIGSVVPPGGVFNVLLFGEGSGGASFTHVFNPSPILTGAWTTFTGSYTIPLGTNVSNGVSFLIEAVCGGDAGCSVTANIDNVSVKVTISAPTCSDGVQNGDETGIDCGGSCAPCVANVPTVAAPVPTPLQSQVINMYSNSYTTDVNVSSWRSGWSTSTYTNDVQVDGPGSEVKRYIDADFVGVEFYAPNQVDATGMNYFHLDVWSPNATVFRVKLVDLGAGVKEGELAFNIAQGQWVSLDIPLVDFADASKVTNPANLLTAKNSIQQLIFSGLPTGTFDFFVDNIYFSSVQSLGTKNFEIAGLKAYPNPSQNSWTVKTQNVTIASINVFDMLGKQVLSLAPNATETTIEGSSLKSGLYFAQIETASGVTSLKLVKK